MLWSEDPVGLKDRGRGGPRLPEWAVTPAPSAALIEMVEPLPAAARIGRNSRDRVGNCLTLDT